MAAALAVARADLEALLRTRKLDRTLTTARPFPEVADEAAVAATGIASLDQLLGGGVPRGQVSEVIGARSSGRTSLLTAMLAAALSRGELAALIDPLDMFDPVSAASAGVPVERLLWVRGEAGTGGGRLASLVDRGLKAFNLVLQAGGFGLVALDLAEAPAAALKQAPWTTWFRLQRVVEGSRTACVLVGPEPVARSAGGVTISLRADRAARWAGGVTSLLIGLDIEARIVRSRLSTASVCRFGLAACEGGTAVPAHAGR